MSDEVTLYNGTVRLAFDAKKHVYTVATTDGYVGAVPSITTILKVIGKGDALTQWAANCAADYIREALTPGQSLDEIQIGSLADSARFAFRRASSTACSIGTLAHAWIESYLSARQKGLEIPQLPVNPSARSACYSALKWFDSVDYLPVEMESRLYSLRHGYAGTADLIAAQVRGRLCVIDYKTSKALYPEYRLQTAAYAGALSEMTGKRIHDRWLVRIGKENADLETLYMPAKEFKADFQAFLHALGLYLRLEQLKP